MTITVTKNTAPDLFNLSLSVNIPQILTSPSPPTATLLHQTTRALADVKKRDVNCIASNIPAVK